jgi:hypothetical protein
MSAISVPAVITLLIFLSLNIAAGVWVYFLNKDLKTCEQKESAFCPFYTCQIPDQDCGIASYRISDGKKVCQTPLVNSALVKTASKPNN